MLASLIYFKVTKCSTTSDDCATRRQCTIARRALTGPIGPLRFEDIVSVDTQPDQYSSQLGGIQIVELEKAEADQSISMDPPDHGWRRKVVSPAVAPANLAKLEGIIRSRVTTILDELPRQEPFDWVDRVSIELTTRCSLPSLISLSKKDASSPGGRKSPPWRHRQTVRPFPKPIVLSYSNRALPLSQRS